MFGCCSLATASASARNRAAASAPACSPARIIFSATTRLRSVRSLDPAKRVFSLFDEFMAFALKGNVIDLAVAVIIGAAFGKIVDSLVKQIIMPLVSVVLPGKQGYLDWKNGASNTVSARIPPMHWLAR